MPSLAKIPLILVAAILFEHGNTQPTSNETEEEQKRARSTASLLVAISEKAVPFTNFMVKAVYWTMSGAEIASILALRYPSHALAPYIHTLLSLSNPRAHASTIGAMSPTYLLGALLVISGSLIRLRCFQEMGRHFTFRLSLRKDHKLCTTGPYSIIRHPGYTGALCLTLGQSLTLAGSGSWWAGVGGWKSGPLGKVYSVLLVACVVAYSRILPRVSQEDEYLRKEFKEEWEQWARKVPYRLFPGIY